MHYLQNIILISYIETLSYLILPKNAFIYQSDSYKDDTSFNQQRYFKLKIMLP